MFNVHEAYAGLYEKVLTVLKVLGTIYLRKLTFSDFETTRDLNTTKQSTVAVLPCLCNSTEQTTKVTVLRQL